MKKIFIIFSLVIAMTGIIACHSTHKMEVYQFAPFVECDTCSFVELMKKQSKIDNSPRVIVLKSDSFLIYTKRYGDFYNHSTIKYVKDNSELILDSVNDRGFIIPNITNAHFLYNRDSLINIKSNDVYYNKKYLKKQDKKMRRE